MLAKPGDILQTMDKKTMKGVFALPESNQMTHYTNVVIPAGTKVRLGTAGKNAFGDGGGFQVELLKKLDPALWAAGKTLEGLYD